jgi:hypothetical protein
MKRTSELKYGSYPPREPISHVTERYVTGIDKHTFGERAVLDDYPDLSSSTPKARDPGYDHERRRRFPADSRMGNEYRAYKSEQRQFEEHHQLYQDMDESYGKKFGKLEDYDYDARCSLGQVAFDANRAGAQYVVPSVSIPHLPDTD